MLKQSSWFLAIALIALAAVPASADRIRLRSGKVVEATFVGADATNLHVTLGNGMKANFPVADVVAVEFTERTPPPPPPPPPSPAKAPAPVMVPANTVLNVLLTEGIDVDVAQAGKTFRALVDDPIMIDGKVVVPRNAAVVVQAVKVQQSGTIKGADKITLKANSVSFGGRAYEIATTYVEAQGSGEGKRSARKIGGGAGLGAIVGGIAGGGSGAAIGAAVGGATGAIVASQGQEHLKLPAETRLQFQLAAAVTVRP